MDVDFHISLKELTHRALDTATTCGQISGVWE